MIGRVYKIIVSCSNEIYIGSTINELRHRWQDHKQDYKKWKGGITNKISSFELFEKWGIENCKIFLIKEYEVVDKYHLRVFEQIWINKLRPINKNNPFCIGRLYNRDRYVKYLQQNPDFYKDKYQKALEKNPDFNKDKYQKKLQKNPDFYKKKITCECGLEVNKSNHAKHKRTKKHTNRMS